MPVSEGRRLRWWPSLVIALSLIVAGAAMWRAALAVKDEPARLASANRPVDASAAQPSDMSAQNSPTVQADPRDPSKLAVVNRIDLPSPSCALHVSFDGGASWSQTAVPPPAGPAAIACFGPDLAYGADGTLYVAFTSFATVPQSPGLEASTAPEAQWLIRSTDGGRTLSAPTRIGGPLAFQIRISTDPVRPGRLYVAWVQGSALSGWGFEHDENPIVLARSDDFGATWAAPVTVSPPSRRRVVAPSLAVDRAGAPLIAYLDVGDDHLDYNGEHDGKGGPPYRGHWSLVVARSPDGGSTWTDVVVDDAVVPVKRFLVLYPPAPSVAVDTASRRVYVGFHDGRLGDSDVWVWVSGDGGVRWSAARKVNDTVPHDRRSQDLPRLAVAPNGRLDVVYYDRRTDDGDVLSKVSFQSSFDGGRTFRPSLSITDRPFDSRVGLGSDRGMAELGDRLGLVATDKGALAMWTDTRGASESAGKQVLASALIRVTPPTRTRQILRTLGVGLALMGGGLVLPNLLHRHRSKRRKLTG